MFYSVSELINCVRFGGCLWFDSRKLEKGKEAEQCVIAYHF